MYVSAHSNTLVTIQTIQVSWLSVTSEWQRNVACLCNRIAFGRKKHEVLCMLLYEYTLNTQKHSTAHSQIVLLYLCIQIRQIHEARKQIDGCQERQERIIESDCVWIELVECSGAVQIGSVHSKELLSFFSLNRHFCPEYICHSPHVSGVHLGFNVLGYFPFYLCFALSFPSSFKSELKLLSYTTNEV